MQQVKDIKKQMNEYGAKSIPFLFIIDFDMQKPLIFKADELESNNILADKASIKRENKFDEKTIYHFLYFYLFHYMVFP